MLPLSALQHWLFCPRQCALIHLEQVWAENRFTAEGRVLHERAHDGPDETRAGIRIARGLAVRSLTLELSGECDVVEFHANGDIVPVEYKRGKPKVHRADDVQLCAQALCLEEMFATTIPCGFLFYGKRQRRTAVEFDATLRQLTAEAATCLHDLIVSRQTPPAVREKKCDSCSLLEICMPDALRYRRGAEAWFDARLSRSLTSVQEDPGYRD